MMRVRAANGRASFNWKGWVSLRKSLVATVLLAVVLIVIGSALAAPVRTSVVYDSTAKNGPPSNLVSAGPEAYAFASIGDTITLAGTSRKLTNVSVTLSSWGCVTGAWYSGDCSTPTGATFSQPITLTVKDTSDNVLASVTQTFNVPYRPSASPICADGRWYSPGLKTCFNGFASDVTFNLNVAVPSQVKYAISYNTSHYGPAPLGDTNACNSSSGGCPYDSLNVALNDRGPSIGSAAYDSVETVFGFPYTPAVQFKASNSS